jgi:hypothetical protein
MFGEQLLLARLVVDTELLDLYLLIFPVPRMLQNRLDAVWLLKSDVSRRVWDRV